MFRGVCICDIVWLQKLHTMEEEEESFIVSEGLDAIRNDKIQLNEQADHIDTSISVSNSGNDDTKDLNDSENGSSSIENETASTTEDDEDDEPPLLTYSRLKNLPIRLFQRDTISACTFHESVYIFGTHSGLLYFTSPNFELIDTLKCHRSSILSIYTDGINFATASIDGTIVIGLVDDIKSEDLTAFDFKRPLNSVVLDTNFLTTKTFVSGGMAGELVLSQRNWLGNRTDTILSKEESPILAIHKTEEILFWFTSKGINFFDIHSRKILFTVDLPNIKSNHNSNRFELFKPHVYTPERDRIIIGWMDTVWTFKISLIRKDNQDGFVHGNIGSMLSSAASSFRAMPDKEVELEHHFCISMLIAGIASFKDDQLLCLGYEKQFDNQNDLKLKELPPQLKIFNLLNDEEVYNDEIVCKNYENLSLNDYHLGKHVDINGKLPIEYYLICPSDAIKIQELTLKDHYDWFIKRNKYFEAWKIAHYVINEEERLKIGLTYVNELVDENKWSDVAPTIIKVTQDFTSDSNAQDDIPNKNHLLEIINDEWIHIINISLEQAKLDYLVDFVPQNLKSENSIYDKILNFTLDNHIESIFSKLIQIWPTQLLNTKELQEKLRGLSNKDDQYKTYYINQIISLYIREEKYSKALPYMIDLKHSKVLEILRMEPHLLPQVMDRLMDIILIPSFNNNKLRKTEINDLTIEEIEKIFWDPIELLVSNRKSISIDKLIYIFEKQKEKTDVDKLLLCILRKLDVEDPERLKNYENEMIYLFSRFDKKPLLKFLKNKSHYDVEKAIELCSPQTGLYHELIYLWGRIGESKKALSIIIDELNDPSLALEFVKSWGDVELWDFLIEYTTNMPNFVKQLLYSYDYLGERYISVIGAIDDDTTVDEIKSPIRATLLEAERSYRVNKNILEIVEQDTSKYAIDFLDLRNRGILYDPVDKLNEMSHHN